MEHQNHDHHQMCPTILRVWYSPCKLRICLTVRLRRECVVYETCPPSSGWPSQPLLGALIIKPLAKKSGKEATRLDHTVVNPSTRGSHAAAPLGMTSLDSGNDFLHMVDPRVGAHLTRDNCEYVVLTRARVGCRADTTTPHQAPPALCSLFSLQRDVWHQKTFRRHERDMFYCALRQWRRGACRSDYNTTSAKLSTVCDL